MTKMMLALFVVFGLVALAPVAGCTHTFIDISEGECQSDTDCADGDVCTIDICGVDRTCIQIDNPACEPPPDCVPTEEVCNGRDDDCDGETDADAIDRFPIYFDRDGDGFGFDTPTATSSHCPTEDMPPGYVTNTEDCNDSDSAIHPGASETCPYDELDNDCDGLTDEDVVTETRYRDSDGDGYGDPEFSGIVCHDDPPVEGVLVAGDCDDTDPRVHPGATEFCNGWDDDCNGEADESDPHAGEFCWGMLSCGEPDCIVPVPGWLECRETFYGWSLECHLNCVSDETCDDGADNDCDTIVDDGCEPPAECTTDLDCARFDGECLVFHCLANYCFAGERDDDGDGRSLCGGLPEGERYDCDDHDASIHPGAEEICDSGIDNDCDGNTDEGLLIMYYLDADGDGYGDPGWLVGYTCYDSALSNWAPNRGDCDDSDPTVHPGAGCPPCEVTYYQDWDGDGYGNRVSGRAFSCDDNSVVGYITTIGDCDDRFSSAHAGASEICDGYVDEDCDTVVDEDCP